MPTAQKHVIQCRCIMSQFKRIKDPPRHKFVVLSVIDDSDKVLTKFVQCNNCGVIHKVTDISKSEILQGREHMSSIVSIDEVKSSINPKLAGVLEANNCDQPTWEMVQFIIENQKWGEFVVLTSDVEEGMRQGKIVKILGESLFKVESFIREEVVTK